METASPSRFRSGSGCCSQEPENKPLGQEPPACHRAERGPCATLSAVHPCRLAPPPHAPQAASLASLHLFSTPLPSPEARSTSRTRGSRCVASQAMALCVRWGGSGRPEERAPELAGSAAARPVWKEELRKAKTAGGEGRPGPTLPLGRGGGSLGQACPLPPSHGRAWGNP